MRAAPCLRVAPCAAASSRACRDAVTTLSSTMPQQVAAAALSPLESIVAQVNDLLNASNLLMWDASVMMPASTGAQTAHSSQTATLKGIAQQLLLAPDTEVALSQAEAAVDGLADDDVRMRSVQAVRAALDFHRRIPKALLEERSNAAGLAGQAWVVARADDDFTLFLPHLETIVDVGRRYALAAQTGRHAHPYDALLELYEPGETVASLRSLFATLRHGIKPLLLAAKARLSTTRHDFLRREGVFPVAQQKSIAEEL